MAKHEIVKEVEPSYTGVELASQIEIIKALNWYHANKTEKDAAKYLGCEVKYAKNHPTHAWITRMRTRGFHFTEATDLITQEFKQKFESEMARATPTVEVDDEGNVIVAPVVNIQERISAKTDYFIAELEGAIDDFGHGMKPFNAYAWFLKNEVKPIHASKIVEYFKNRADTMIKEVQSKDTKEAYAGLGKAKIKSILTVMASIVTDAERLATNVNKSRKPRKKKAVNFEKIAAKVLYKERDDTLKILSIPPVNLIGASQVWLFNPKTKRLAVYTAEDPAGLFLKGSKLIGYSVSLSYAKTIRKPEKILENVINGGKLVLRKIMDDISGKKYPINGKINRDTVLLRALK